MTTSQFIQRVLIVLALSGLAAAMWAISNVLMLVFGSILLAVILHAIADQVRSRTGMSKGLSLAVAGLLGVALFGGVGFLFGQQISAQLHQVAQQLPGALHNVLDAIGIKNPSDLIAGSSISAAVTKLFSWGATAVDTMLGVFFMIVAGIYIAVDPAPYRDGLIKLFPPSLHPNVSETLDDMGQALRLWFGAQLISMIIVGTMIGVGMWLIGVPSPIALGLIAGVTEFVPFIGPVIGAIPALLIAFGFGPWTVLWALLVVIIVHQCENHLIIPLLVREMVAVPPAVGTFAVITFGTLFGWLGILFGYPLAVVVDVAIRLLYVRERLGEPVRIVAEESRLTEPDNKK